MLKWRELCRMPDADLARLDVAAVNLACAAGLPDSDRIDHDGCLTTLDQWAAGVRRYTATALEQHYRPDPARYHDSEPLFRMVTLVNVLRRHCGVVYHPDRKGLTPFDPFDLEDVCVHAPIQGPGGTCATLPVVFAAVGRRLGYPVRLVRAKSHLFCRWDDPATGERVNIEGSTGEGVNSHPDEHYRTWPYRMTAGERTRFGYLESMTPQQELAAFVSGRATVLECAGQWREAVEAMAYAAELHFERSGHTLVLQHLMDEWWKAIEARYPSGFPWLELDLAGPRRWPGLPVGAEERIRLYGFAEDLLDDPEHDAQWWRPLRAGTPVADVPTRVTLTAWR